MSVDHTPPPPSYDEPPYDDYNPPYQPPTLTELHPTPSHNPDAEQAVLGAMLINPGVINDVTTILEPADYYRPQHEQIHDAILTLHHTDQPIDMVTVAGELMRRGQLQKIGGPTYLHHLTTPETCPVAANARTYATAVRDQARLRAADNAATRIHQIVREARPDDVDRIMGEALQIIETADLRSIPGLTPHTTWAPVDLAPVLAGEHLDPPPTILHREDGIPLLYDHAVHTVSGESESGKTWLLLLAAKQLLEQDQRVVFLDFEDRADRVIGRLLSLGATIPHIQQNFAYIRPDRPLDDTGRTQLEPALADTRLVIIDGVTEAMTMHGYDLNSNADSALFQGLLPRWIADHGPAVAMIDHVVKDKEKQDRFALGAQHKLAGIDGAAYLVKVIQPFARGKRGLARIEVAKDRPGHVREHAHGKTIAEFTIDANHDGLINTAHLMPPTVKSSSGDIFTPTYLMEKISRYVEANPGCSKKVIEGVLNGKTETKRLALELLVTRGYVGVKAGPRNSMQHFSTTPFREDTDDTSGDPDDAWEAPAETPENTVSDSTDREAS